MKNFPQCNFIKLFFIVSEHILDEIKSKILWAKVKVFFSESESNQFLSEIECNNFLSKNESYMNGS